MLFFFFNDTATTEIYTLSLHDALPIYEQQALLLREADGLDLVADAKASESRRGDAGEQGGGRLDRKSTRLNSSHANISYAVFCLKKKNLTPSEGARHTIATNGNLELVV